MTPFENLTIRILGLMLLVSPQRTTMLLNETVTARIEPKEAHAHMDAHRPRGARRRHARKADPKPEPAPIEPQNLVARCLVGGCGWSIPVGRGALKAVEEHRREKHPWCKPGRCHRIEVAP